MSVLWTVVAAGSVSVREGRRGRKELATSHHLKYWVRESQYFCLFIRQFWKFRHKRLYVEGKGFEKVSLYCYLMGFWKCKHKVTNISMLKEKAWKKWACTVIWWGFGSADTKWQTSVCWRKRLGKSELVLLFDRVLEVQTQNDKHQYVEGKGLEKVSL